MKDLFWFCVSLIFLTYAGYPIWLHVKARYRPMAIRQSTIFPSVTILLAVRNEERNLPRKLQNLAALSYPLGLMQQIVVSDGSTDGTDQIAAGWQNSERRLLILPQQAGKAVALNCGMAEATGEIVVFTDARQILASDSLNMLVSNFADPSVGCVSGELMINQDPRAGVSEGVGLYWKMEKKIRLWEAVTGSTIGATGAFYAVRRNLLSTLPPDTILDDLYIPMHVVRQGYRVVFEPRALAWDDLQPGPKQEFQRKVRTLIGNYQLLQLAPWILTASNPVRLQFVMHKLLRLLVPFALLGVLISSISLRQGIYGFALVVQLAFYSSAAFGIFRARLGPLSRVSDISLAFLVLNSAAAVAFVYFVIGRKVLWAR
jgi:biofilm PGA synthesis N-glycosyltransferase PgaC